MADPLASSNASHSKRPTSSTELRWKPHSRFTCCGRPSS